MTSLTAIALVVGLGVTLPLYAGMEATIREHLERLARGERVPMIAIGCFTEIQFAAINEGRAAMELHRLEQNEILSMVGICM
ncbi:hypothetical protein [Bradyrhizobium algeriense]|uniref:hypothetical protein n=1 Tax=Bradyrhizobium algeriense TaxID=634784 RepID=UPI000D338D63|nr:hypothetical protein [Bradyrhizobium algeriense]